MWVEKEGFLIGSFLCISGILVTLRDPLCLTSQNPYL